MNNFKLIIGIFLLSFIAVNGNAAELKENIISRQEIKADANFKADGKTFFMCNITCAEENTVLADVKNNTFIRSNITNCILDDSNSFKKSNYVSEQPEVIEEETYEDLQTRVAQLETFITSKSLIIPIKDVIAVDVSR